MVEVSLTTENSRERLNLILVRASTSVEEHKKITNNDGVLIDSENLAERSRALDNRSLLYKVTKRTFDITISSLVIMLGFLPALILALLIMISTGGSPMYSQARVGLYGQQFRIYKFRTMVADSDNIEKYFTLEQIQTWHRERKVDNDPRVTRLGRILRETSVDELPNFVNVFLGHMSAVGPRAITYDELKWFGSDAGTLLSVRPGVTGWWQVNERNKATYQSGLRQKEELFYVQSKSLLLDFRILLKTTKAVWSKTGV